MRIEDIVEGKSYVDGSGSFYWRTVEMIVGNPKRPGGKVVAWSTDGFEVKERSQKKHGKCGIKTFAAWAKGELGAKK